MVYSILKRIESEGGLGDCTLSFFHPETINRKGHVYGRDVTAITRSSVVFTGGETGQEEMTMPLETILEVHAKGEIVFRRKKKVKKIYPRT